MDIRTILVAQGDQVDLGRANLVLAKLSGGRTFRLVKE